MGAGGGAWLMDAGEKRWGFPVSRSLLPEAKSNYSGYFGSWRLLRAPDVAYVIYGSVPSSAEP